MRLARHAAVALVLAVAAGCGGTTPPRSMPSPAARGSASPPAATSPSSAARLSAPAGTAAVSASPTPAAADQVHLTDVRLAGHPGYDRVVFEFREPALPGYVVRYVRPPVTEDGSGRPVDVQGSAYLEVRMEPASTVDLAHASYSPTYTGPRRVPGRGTSDVTEVVRTGDFEGVLTWVVGLRATAPFRVTTLQGPARIVVDLMTA